MYTAIGEDSMLFVLNSAGLVLVQYHFLYKQLELFEFEIQGGAGCSSSCSRTRTLLVGDLYDPETSSGNVKCSRYSGSTPLKEN